MYFFETQSGQFSFSLSFSVKTGAERSWEFYGGFLSGSNSEYSNPNLVQELNSGGLNSLFSADQSNNYAFLGSVDEQKVDVYSNSFYIDESNSEDFLGEDFFRKQNSVTGVGIEGVSGFGRTVRGIDETVIVGAPYSNSGSGAAFVFQSYLSGNNRGATGNSSWGQRNVLSGSISGQSINYGTAADLIEDEAEYLVAISATGENEGTGAVYIYKNTSEDLVKKITPEEDGIQKFGRSLRFCLIDEVRYLAIGCEQNGTGQVRMSKESLPSQKDFSLYRTIESESSHDANLFGYTIDNAENSFLIGAPNQDASGAAYYYLFNEEEGFFELSQKITDPAGSNGDHFGKNVSFDGVDAIITSDKNFGEGLIYHQSDGQWTNVSRVSGDSNTVNGSFGGSTQGSFCTSLTKDVIVVGSNSDSFAYYFTTGDWGFQTSTGISFSGSGSKIYDQEGHFLYGLKPNQLITISGDIYDNCYSTYIDQQLCNSKIEMNSSSMNWVEYKNTGDLVHYDFSIYSTERPSRKY